LFVCLNPHRHAQREKKNDYVLIEDVARDIEEDANDTMQDHPPLLSVGVMERSLVSRLSVEPKADEVGSNYFDYLVGCFRIGTACCLSGLQTRGMTICQCLRCSAQRIGEEHQQK